MRAIRGKLTMAIVAVFVSACALDSETFDDQEPGREDLVASETAEFLVEGQEIGNADGNQEARGGIAPGTHCVSTTLPTGADEELEPPICFGTFAESIAYATDGLVQLPDDATTVTQEQLDSGYDQVSSDGIGIQAIVIGISYWDSGHSGSSWAHTASSGCDDDSGYEWYISGGFAGWNDEISSAQGFSGCQGVYFEHANFVGASIATSWSGGAMSDRASSVYWR